MRNFLEMAIAPYQHRHRYDDIMPGLQLNVPEAPLADPMNFIPMHG